MRYKLFLSVLMLCLITGPVRAATGTGEGVNDEEVIKQAVLITAEDTDPSKNTHLCTIKCDRRDGAVVIEVSLMGHSKEPDQSLEAFRIYEDEKLITKYLMKPQWNPYHFMAYINAEKFPKGTKLILLTNCTVDGPYKQEFVVP